MSPSTVAIFVGPILTVDAAVSRAIHTAAKPFLPPFLLLLLEISADFRFSFPVSLSLLLSPPLRAFLVPFLLGLLFDLIFVGIVKLIFRRARPAYNHPSMSAAVPADHYSFPSGHASRVFFVAASVHFFSAVVEAPMVSPSYTFLDGWVRDHNDGDVKGEVVVAVWIWATLTAISRILLGRHYVLDVAAGACLGILEALFALRFLRFDEKIFGSCFYSNSCRELC
ncbi:probable lipid phosphate phosphatase beta isoform X2 [Capsella rubella]|uniref:probable lipid phosphate phosphatase beta isoform X2 n=1 Tax=Capsella rubella TaxID=81985 RepID=UPI000CD5BDC3|nr:probable lipid phosphate phosphatase beta isoform X2 [Capsella rubella]